MDYFTFTDDGTTINLNDKYRYLIKEPITLHLMNGNIGITTIGNFGVWYDQSVTDKIQIPRIYFLNNGVNSHYTIIQKYAFYSAPQASDISVARVLLQHIYLPSSIKRINESAFQGCRYLETINLPNASKEEGTGITTLERYAFDTTGKIQIEERDNYQPLANLKEIGVSSFYGAGDGVYLTKIPTDLKVISAWAFANCSNVSISDFSEVTNMGLSAFYECGKNTDNIDITLPENISKFVDGCFNRYAIGNIDTVRYSSGGSVSNEDLSRLGLSLSNPITFEQVIE